jgi:hypothetical protein
MGERSILAPALIACCLAQLGAAQPENLCYAFLRSKDVHVTCGGKSDQITHRGNVDQFAISEEQAYLGFVTSLITMRTATAADAVYTTSLVDLGSGKLVQKTEQVGDVNHVVSTCGGIFRAFDPTRDRSGTVDLITGARVEMPPYRWFVCSSDRKVVFGSLGPLSGEGGLYEGMPPVSRAPALPRYNAYSYNISPDGSKIAYETGSSPLCVLTSSAPPQCAGEALGETFKLSVNNAGEVLIVERDPKGGYVGIGFWKPGPKSLQIVEPHGDAPQWISPATADLLRNWSAQQGEKSAK